jgi:hypothetical protein
MGYPVWSGSRVTTTATPDKPQGSRDHDDPQNRMHDETEDRRDHNDDYGYEDVKQHVN